MKRVGCIGTSSYILYDGYYLINDAMPSILPVPRKEGKKKDHCTHIDMEIGPDKKTTS
jgi:hypothetical protein